MFGKSSAAKRVKSVIPEFAEVMMLWGVDQATALRWGAQFANQALEDSQKVLSVADESENIGELLIDGGEAQTPYGKFFLNKVHENRKVLDADWVTFEDEVWYWSMPLLERNFIFEMSNAYRTALSMRVMQMKDWDSEEQMKEAIKYEVALNSPLYGSFQSGTLSASKDLTRPLPIVLYKRIETYRSIPWDDATKKLLAKADNQNAFLRGQLKKGIL